MMMSWTDTPVTPAVPVYLSIVPTYLPVLYTHYCNLVPASYLLCDDRW